MPKTIWIGFIFVFQKSLKRTFKHGFWVQNYLLICVLAVWIHKGYCVVKKLVWNVNIKAFLYPFFFAFWWTNIFFADYLRQPGIIKWRIYLKLFGSIILCSNFKDKEKHCYVFRYEVSLYFRLTLGFGYFFTESFNNLSVSLSLFLPFSLSLSLYFFLGHPVHLFICLYISLSIYLSIYLYNQLIKGKIVCIV